MIERSLEEIAHDVANTGEARADWAHLSRMFFRESGVDGFKEWAANLNLDWDTLAYDRGDGMQGHTILFADASPSQERVVPLNQRLPAEPASDAQLHLLASYRIASPPELSRARAELLIDGWNRLNPESQSQYEEWKRSLQNPKSPYARTRSSPAYGEIVRAMPRPKQPDPPDHALQLPASVSLSRISWVFVTAAGIGATLLIYSCAGR